MDRTLAGLIGTVALTAGALTSAEAAQRLDTTTALHASSYGDLLKPIPDALAAKAAMAGTAADAAEAPVVLAQYHHHHHHRRVYHRRHYHHDE